MIAALALSGCTVQHGEQSSGSGSNPPTPPVTVSSGSLVFGGGATDACADGSVAHAFTFGIPVTNRSDADVQLVSAEFENIAGAELIGTWLVGPEVDDDDPGASVTWTDDYPPDVTDQPGWAVRTDIDETSISPHSSTWIAYALKLTEGSDVGAVADLSLSYEDAAGMATVRAPGSSGIGQVTNGEFSCAP